MNKKKGEILMNKVGHTYSKQENDLLNNNL